MPQLKPVKCLLNSVLEFCAEKLHIRAKKSSKLKNSSKRNRLTRNQVGTFVSAIPASLLNEFWKFLESLILRESIMLDENYYKLVGGVVTPNTRILRLDQPKLFQESSLAVESFLGTNLFECARLTELQFTKRVVDLIDFNFESYLLRIGGSFPHLRFLVFQGLKQIELEAEIIEQFLLSISQICKSLQHLDLTESNLNPNCFEIISKMISLRVVLLSHSSGLSSIGIVLLLQRLRNLVRCEAHRGNQSSLQSAVSACHRSEDQNENEINNLQNSFSAKLQHFTFRAALQDSIEQVTQEFKSVKNVRVMFNVFELGMTAKLDDLLKKLENFESFRSGELNLELEVSGLNLLFIIQMPNLEIYGSSLTKLCLSECEFVHPQTLNPLARCCPNLAHLTLENPTTVPDDLFVGEVPELAERPFENLKVLVYEGENLPRHVAKFILGHSVFLEQLQLSLDTLSLEILAIFHILAKIEINNLQRLSLCFGQNEFVQMNNIEYEDNFSNLLTNFVESAPVLDRLQVYVLKNGNAQLESEMEILFEKIRTKNWNIDFQFQIKYRKLKSC